MSTLRDITFNVVDVETTGRSAERNRITEVACVVVRGGEIAEERSTLINPEQYIPRTIQEMTGISNAMVVNAPKGREAFPDVRSWFPDDSVFVAHHVTFDFNFLQHSFDRHGVRGLHHPTLCTVRLARRLLPNKKGFALHKVASYFGITIRDRHRALGDAHATAKVLTLLLQMAEAEHACADLNALLRLQYRPTTTFREKPANVSKLEPVIRSLPSSPGIYKMLSRAGEVLYVGKALNLRDRVGSYFRPGADHEGTIREMVRRVRSIEIEECGSELGALIRESRLIKELQPRFNTLGRRLRRYAFLRLDPDAALPKIELAREVEPDGAEYFGPFRNREAAETIIEAIDHLFRLRKCDDPPERDPGFRPCIYHQIDRCDAPCADRQSDEEYRAEVERVRRALNGSEEGIVGLLREKMAQCAERLEFEEAAALRDRIEELRRVFVWRRQIAESINNNNAVVVLPATGSGRRELFAIRFGALAGQLTLGERFPEVGVRRLLERTYFDGADRPPHFSRLEIDEIRIIAGYLKKKGADGEVISVGREINLDDLCGSVRMAASGTRGTGAVRVQESAA